MVSSLVDSRCPLSTDSDAPSQYVGISDPSIAVVADTGVLGLGSFVMGSVTLLVALSFAELQLPGQFVSV